jgi:hypothetical protein
MPIYEYKVLYGSPTGHWLMPWASQKMRDEMGVGSFEKKLNRMAEEGWEVISCSTASAGGFFYFSPYATAILRREKK